MDQVTVPSELLRQILSFVEEGNPGHIADKINVLVKLRTALEQPAVEPVACLVRYRSLRTSANTAFDGRDHYAEWTQWVPHTIEYGRAVTDPARNSQGGGAIFEMQPLYTAQQPAPVQEPVAELDLYVDEGGPCLTFTPKWYGHLSNGKHNLYAAPSAQPAVEPVAEVVMAAKPPNSSPAWLPFKTVYASIKWLDSAPVGTKLFTAPQAQRPVMLTPEQVEQHIGYRLPSHSMKLLLDLFAQQPRKAVKLTDEEIAQIAAVSGKMLRDYAMGKSNEKPTVFARALEAAVLKKNGVMK